MTPKTCTMKSTEKQLLYEIKERITRIEDYEKVERERMDELHIWTKTHETEDREFEDMVKSRLGKYDNYFALRTELMKVAIVVLFGMCSALLAWRFMPN